MVRFEFDGKVLSDRKLADGVFAALEPRLEQLEPKLLFRLS